MHKLEAGEVVVTRRVHFNAAHRLFNNSQTEQWNIDTFGPCFSPNWHGHNYNLEVQVAGIPNADTGFVIDLAKLRDLVDEVILKKCDHKNLNLDVDFLSGIIPSSENLVITFWQQLEGKITDGRLYCIRLYETERNWVEYFGSK